MRYNSHRRAKKRAQNTQAFIVEGGAVTPPAKAEEEAGERTLVWL